MKKILYILFLSAFSFNANAQCPASVGTSADFIQAVNDGCNLITLTASFTLTADVPTITASPFTLTSDAGGPYTLTSTNTGGMGAYTSNLEYNGAGDITLTDVNLDAEHTGCGGCSAFPGISITTTGAVNMNDVNITSDGEGIVINNSVSSDLDGVTVNSTGTGITLNNSINATVTNCIVNTTSGEGITLNAVQTASITNNSFGYTDYPGTTAGTIGGAGINIVGAGDGITVTGNYIGNTGWHGIRIDGGQTNLDVNGNFIGIGSDGSTHPINNSGITMQNVTSGAITNNTIVGGGFEGVYVSGGVNADLSGNSITCGGAGGTETENLTGTSLITAATPVINLNNTTTAGGTIDPSYSTGTITLYRQSSGDGAVPCDMCGLEEVIGTATVDGSGTWSVTHGSWSGSPVDEFRVTAVYTDGSGISGISNCFPFTASLSANDISLSVENLLSSNKLRWVCNNLNKGNMKILKSHDGKKFHIIDEIEKNNKDEFSYVDYDKSASIVYYKIVFNGLTKELSSNIVKLNNLDNKITIFPNPSVNKVINVSINQELSQEVTFKIYDLIGEEVSSFTFTTNLNQLNLNKLSKGTYILETNIESLIDRKIIILR